jgi:steroid 5-alpha reductase family enzyme
LFFRNYGKEEDFRYQEFRRNYGPQRYWWVSFFQVFLLQGALILIVSLPLLGVNLNTQNNELHALDYLAIFIWCIGFFFEAVGDYQLSKFKKNSNNKGQVLNKGLWRYTRHPNYFGDATVWCAFALFSIASGSWWHIIGSGVMIFLIIKVSGVFLLEKTLKNTKPKYKDYVARTNSFFPWFPKK